MIIPAGQPIGLLLLSHQTPWRCSLGQSGYCVLQGLVSACGQQSFTAGTLLPSLSDKVMSLAPLTLGLITSRSLFPRAVGLSSPGPCATHGILSPLLWYTCPWLLPGAVAAWQCIPLWQGSADGATLASDLGRGEGQL